MSEIVSGGRLADAVRFLAMDAVERAQSGHPGMPMGMADAAAVLFRDFLRFDAEAPDWHDRDRFVLSAGHGSMLLYALLYLTGYQDCTLDELKNFRQLGSKTAGHPEYGHLGGIETTTGPLGQGLGNAVGMALAERLLNARFGDEIADHYTYVIAGDGCLMEGISQEAITLAGHLSLSRLIVLFDDNGITIDGKVSLCSSEDRQMRFRAAGFDTFAVDGHDHDALHDAIAAARASDTPSLICCRTHIGFGAPNKQDSEKAHGSPLGADEIAGVREALGWDSPPFEIPQEILREWRGIGARHREARQASQHRLDGLAGEKKQLFQQMMTCTPPDFAAWMAALEAQWHGEVPTIASRKASEFALVHLMADCPFLLGGSADLTGSNNTKTGAHRVVSAGDFSGNYLHYGIREHGMAAVMNGVALHGGFVPYGGTFLVFSDYMRPAMRLSALMRQKVIYVLTHDSIGLGEDGPTHQPVEHLASLRAIPHLHVFRPADALETAQCWHLALGLDVPSALVLSRQTLPALPNRDFTANACARGGYVVCGGDDAHVTILASGSEVGLAVEAHQRLAGEGIAVRVVSVPCRELFDALPQAERAAVLGSKPKIAVEAGVAQGWQRYGVDEDVMLAMRDFGVSAPAKDAFAHFGFTTQRLMIAVKNAL